MGLKKVKISCDAHEWLHYYCPYCHKEIDSKDDVCPHCEREFISERNPLYLEPLPDGCWNCKYREVLTEPIGNGYYKDTNVCTLWLKYKFNRHISLIKDDTEKCLEWSER